MAESTETKKSVRSPQTEQTGSPGESTAAASLDPQSSDLGWHITRRWHAYEGEIRTSILRAALVSVFYGIQLINHLGFSVQDAAAVIHHQRVTYLCGGWLLVSLAVLVALRQRIFPPAIKFLTTAFDLAFLTFAAAIGTGTASPLVGCFFLIIAMATLRFSLPLIWFTTIGAMVSYMALVGLGDPTWFDSDHTTSPVTQMVTLSALAATGVVLGQVVRMLRSLAEEFHVRYEYLDGLAKSQIVDLDSSEVQQG